MLLLGQFGCGEVELRHPPHQVEQGTVLAREGDILRSDAPDALSRIEPGKFE